MHDHGFGDGDIVPRHQFREIDLVGALQYGIGIIHHHQALGPGALGKSEGVMIDRRGFTYEQGIEFRETRNIIACDQFHIETDGFRRLLKLL